MNRMLKCATCALVAFAFYAGFSVSSAEIVVAQVAPCSGPLAPTGILTRAGAQLCFDAVNAAGGIHGHKIRLVTRGAAASAST